MSGQIVMPNALPRTAAGFHRARQSWSCSIRKLIRHDPSAPDLLRHCPFMLKLGSMKVSYRSLAKNVNRAYAMLALINVSKMRESKRVFTGEVSTAYAKCEGPTRLAS
jgi:hypothetical protein